jgi:hypothetical protein
MKRFNITLFIVCIFMISGPIAVAQVPMNWTRDEINPGEDFTLTQDESFFTEGFKSLHMQLNSGAAPYLVSDVYYITPGAAYNFSVDVFDNDTAGQVKIYADFYDTYGFNIFGEPPAFSSDSAEWQTISWQGTVPGQAVVGYILIKFHNQPDLYHFTRKAEAWVDQVRFEQAPGVNMVANGGFEEWNVGIEEPGNNHQSISVYPNPAKNWINFKLPELTEFITITELMGREVIKVNPEIKGNYRIDITYLPEGIYFFSAFQQDNITINGKFIISR